MSKTGGLVAKGTRVAEGWVVVARCPLTGEYVALGTVATLADLKATLMALAAPTDPEVARWAREYRTPAPARRKAAKLWGMDLRRSTDEDRRAA